MLCNRAVIGGVCFQFTALETEGTQAIKDPVLLQGCVLGIH